MLIFSLHSVSSAITNSSTTVFVFDSNKTIESVKEIIDTLCELYAKANSEYEGDELKELYGLEFLSGEEVKKEFKWYEEFYEWEFNQINDDENYIVYSENGDNSMPHDLEEMINDLFDGIHIHLG